MKFIHDFNKFANSMKFINSIKLEIHEFIQKSHRSVQNRTMPHIFVQNSTKLHRFALSQADSFKIVQILSKLHKVAQTGMVGFADQTFTTTLY